jgi:hypothetical protein
MGAPTVKFVGLASQATSVRMIGLVDATSTPGSWPRMVQTAEDRFTLRPSSGCLAGAS